MKLVTLILCIQVEQNQSQQGDDEFCDSVPAIFHIASYFGTYPMIS